MVTTLYTNYGVSKPKWTKHEFVNQQNHCVGKGFKSPPHHLHNKWLHMPLRANSNISPIKWCYYFTLECLWQLLSWGTARATELRCFKFCGPAFFILPGLLRLMETILNFQLCVLFSFFAVSIVLFLVSRFSPHEWRSISISDTHLDHPITSTNEVTLLYVIIQYG